MIPQFDMTISVEGTSLIVNTWINITIETRNKSEHTASISKIETKTNLLDLLKQFPTLYDSAKCHTSSVELLILIQRDIELRAVCVDSS